ncbi:hypothetical protein GCM10023116_43700 [Kistimonas scapharcae]|uniref:Bacteriophage tail tape measure C-terminal domain-containing protein n=1 Tax=Kistimonas scapharcae TaxID=1036133 RepID=A0ABP8V9M8_9GAMM
MVDVAELRIAVKADGARRADDALKRLVGTSKTAEVATGAVGRAFKSAGMAIGAVSLTIGAAVAAYAKLATAIGAAGQKVRDLENLADMAGVSAERFQALAYATEKVGISGEKFADVSKDITDKLGDFIATGGGEFKDFFEQVAPQVGLTAEALQGLAGPEVLQAVKNAMDAANISAEEQVFYLEAIANDASRLAPLLANNGKEMERLTNHFADAGLVMSDMERQHLRDFNTAWGDLTKTFDIVKDKVLASIADPFRDATLAIQEFFGAIWGGNMESLKADLAGVNRELERQQSNLEKLSGNNSRGGMVRRAALEEEITANKQKQAELQAKINDLEQAKERQALPDGGNGNQPPTVVTGRDISIDEHLSELRQRNLSELALLTEKQQAERDQMDAWYQDDLISKQEHTSAMLEIDRHYSDERKRLTDDRLQAEKQAQEQAAREQERIGAARVQYEQQVQQMQMQLMANGIGAVRSSLEEGSDAWVAATLAQKGIMVAQAMMQTQLAAIQAYSAMLIPGNPASVAAATAMSSKITALGYANAAMIGATAVGEIAGARSHGGQALAGNMYRGGEFGGEMFVGRSGSQYFIPPEDGNVVPNHKLGSGGGNTSVTVINNTGQQAETRQSTDADGNKLIEVIVGKLSDQIRRGVGFGQTMQSAYGLNRLL